ncbi:N-acetylglucosamine kinase [Lederbergia wuyishanensis]|uniref:N-acetylglucosamine kinase-like BadF-type ATPase n=1 Tax=Lederbergia wuyishanensis TaxID=1347903 RepID=A0ABU0DAA7_9BACI|nr:BadF/BadG/BcrA/BcrD ATPase family protein [Lederbergia wuyishanensis]MCJ8009919.1 ATPase [Lederbergia wuyishanensis]MDQ0345266.1 N-acetylglucosamine kinase-like BadF-type ATPase [Lederbergia wuyishanensis]
MPIIMGVDGGGSKTFTVISDENGNLLGKGVSGGGGGNYQTVGIDKAVENITASIEAALKSAGLDYKDIDFVQYGLAGADRPKDIAIIESGLKRIPFENWDLVCDTMEGLRIGSKNFTGVVLVCGTGTNAAGRNNEGKQVQIGGFGYFFGDYAGGAAMAQETFRAAVRSWEQREQHSVLTEKVSKYFGFNNMEEVFNHFLDNDMYHVPNDLALILHEAADEGDPLAISLMEKMGKELGLAASAVIKNLGDLNQPIPIVLTGSIVQKGQNKYLLEALRKIVEAEHQKQIELVIPDMEPVYGSVLLGMDHLGINATDDIYEKFNSYGGYEE